MWKLFPSYLKLYVRSSIDWNITTIATVYCNILFRYRMKLQPLTEFVFATYGSFIYKNQIVREPEIQTHFVIQDVT